MQKVYTISEVAEAFGVTRETVYRWVRKGHITAIQMGKRGKYMIPRESIDAMLRENKNQ